MLALISLILVMVGCANWLTIGLLQFDFVAGLFGSQSNIFSRIIYVIVGIAAVCLAINIIKNKGKIAFNFKKLNFKKKNEPVAQMESSHDNHSDEKHTAKQESSTDNYRNDNTKERLRNLSQKASSNKNN